MRCALELLEVVLCVLYVGEVVFCVPLCMLEAVEGVLSAGNARGDALCAVRAGGFVPFAGGAGGRALYAALYAGGRGGRPLCAGAAGGCAPFAGGYWLDSLGLLRAQRFGVEVESRDSGDCILFCNVGSGSLWSIGAQFGRCGGV